MSCLLALDMGFLTLCLFVWCWDSVLQMLTADPRAGLEFLLSASGVRTLSHRYTCLFHAHKCSVLNQSPAFADCTELRQSFGIPPAEAETSRPHATFSIPQCNLECQLPT